MEKIEEMENKIYDTYYKKNPKGDARNNLWGMVIRAKITKDSISALEEILECVEKGLIK